MKIEVVNYKCGAENTRAAHENRPLLYGDKVTYAGEHSYFRGYFLGYVYKLPWTDPEGKEHPAGLSCTVQQEGTGTVFVKPAPTEKNRGWTEIL